MAGPVIVGADVGGSKAHVVVSAVGEPERDLNVPSSAWYRGGLASVAEGLAELLTDDERSRLAAFVVGAHGCDNREQCHRLEAELARRLDGEIVALNDAELVLPATGRSSGVGLIVGTGSIAVGYLEGGAMLAIGGWGGYVGDEGSATGLFRDAAKAAIFAYDRGRFDEPLIGVFESELGLADLRDLPGRMAANLGPTVWASYAPAVFERALAAGSSLAREVLRDSALALAELVAVLEARGADTSFVAAAGGVVANAEWMRSALVEAFAMRVPGSELSFLLEPPVRGALRLASDLMALRSGGVVDSGVHPRLAQLLSAEREN